MLERYFVKPQTIDRIRTSWLGPHIEFYVTSLTEQGYSARSILRRVPILMQFEEFARARHITSLAQAEGRSDAFVADWLAARCSTSTDLQRRDRNFARGVIAHFFGIAVWKRGYCAPRPALPDPFAAQAPGFFTYLRDERGLRPSSILLYRHALRKFEAYLERVDCHDLQAISMPIVTGFITTMAQEIGSSAMTGLACSLRVWLRYLKREGILARDLSKMVEAPQHYRLAEIPRSINWEAVQAMLDQVDRRTPVGRRDYAMLLLMVTYGLRAREVAALTLGDIDWKRDRLHVRGRKADHKTAYPLASVVGEAIIAYLQNGRPDLPARAIFCRHLAPLTPLTHAAVSSCASKYLHKAGIPVYRPGSHTLRHACVQRLVDSGFPLRVIGDYVGHRSASSTMIYAKVQIDALRDVALGDGEDLL